ncbi:Asp23/Gls24 family envelope stress response protein [Allonocardiopsis opalescens]|uniref:Putative alkaline shock family protein YloU n=1 Tax=Allonocardiopsis opalescens TaxID=1144618 RepID=A0A2T0PW31_9ACTN|nr:Asp23/Gls24 family envelope stress response protein [Allonocardiopsis opalescens]PRX95745.1 putative alkaline shock family protein YloU [Allonocardiopsis opalescens]
MSSIGTATAPARRPGTAPRTAVRRAADRGVTVIAPRVVEKIAAQAVTEVDGTARAPRRGGRAKATATVRGRAVSVRLGVSLVYPQPVREVSRRVRERVADRLSTLTGMKVRHVDIRVDRYLPGPPERRGGGAR